MGDVQDPDGPRRHAVSAGAGELAEGGQEDLSRLWAELTQVVGDTDTRNHHDWYKYHLTHHRCLPYHARAEGGQRFLKGAAAPSSQEGPQGQNGVA